VGGLGVDNARPRLAGGLGGVDPGAELVRKRLQELKDYRWSSWRVYQGAEVAPGWLQTGVVGAGCGGRSREEQRQALQEYTQTPVRQGRMDSLWTGLIGGLVLGSQEYAQGLLKGLKSQRVDGTVMTSVRPIQRTGRLGWPEIVTAAEALLGKRRSQRAESWGDGERDGTIYVAVIRSWVRVAPIICPGRAS